MDPKAGTASISHGPVSSLKWPAMTMEFKSPAGGLPPGLKAGDAIRFDFVITRDGEYQTTKVEAMGHGAHK